MAEYRFIEPLDAIFLRGNRLFGQGSAPGDAVMPPWPSVFAGATRSWMLASAGVSPAAFGAGKCVLEGPLGKALGTAEEPGEFVLAHVTLGRESDAGVEVLYPCPADIVISVGSDENISVDMLEARALPNGLHCSLVLPQAPVLRREARGKAVNGYWLTSTGWRRYLLGEAPAASECIHQRELWTLERRLGIGMDKARRTAAEGQLYTTDAVHLSRDPRVGFVVAIDGVDASVLPVGPDVLRLGGDGRGASIRSMPIPGASECDAGRIMQSRRFRLVLTSPGIFSGGWRLPGLDTDGSWRFPGGRARIVCAAVGRGQTVSGWDLATRQPKPAQRVAPTGSVYWFEEFEGDTDALRNLSTTGLWSLVTENENQLRRAEGFNRFIVANA